MAALEQEIASVIRFILDSVPGITPYYWDIPEGFVVPSVFFPQPELTPLGDTFASYAVEYDWYIKFFASTDEDAYASAAAALNAICAARLLVPLIDEAGAANRAATVMLQRLLGITHDGGFGPATTKALMEVQRKHGLAADGICGPKSWTVLSGADKYL